MFCSLFLFSVLLFLSVSQFHSHTQVQWCSGSVDEFASITKQLVANGTFIRLNERTRPGSFLTRTDPRDAEPVHDKYAGVG
jgi:phosphoenolpyruvate carboxykinase (GTP)